MITTRQAMKRERDQCKQAALQTLSAIRTRYALPVNSLGDLEHAIRRERERVNELVDLAAQVRTNLAVADALSDLLRTPGTNDDRGNYIETE